MTIIFYAKAGSKHCVGLRLAGWGVAVMAGALLTLASAILFYSGNLAESMVHKKESRHLVEHELAQLKREVRLVTEANRASLDVATAKLGGLYGRMLTLDAKGASLLGVTSLDPDSPEDGIVAFRLPEKSLALGTGSAAAN